ncbi:tyrosine-type recombinase/integrase [Shinella zoogloeoides]
MTTIPKKELTLADVREQLAKSSIYSEKKRRRMDNSFKAIWRYTGLQLEKIPATMAGLSDVVNKIEPAAHGVGRPTIINMRNHIMHAMKQTGAVPELQEYRERRPPLSPMWALFAQRLTTRHSKTMAWSLMHFANARGLAPRDIDDAQLTLLSEHLRATSPRPNQYGLVRQIVLNWNRLRLQMPDLDLKELTPPPARTRRLPFALADFPQSFQDSVGGYRQWLVQEDVFDDDAKERKVAASTADNYIRRIHRCASHLANSGVAVSCFTDLRVLVEVEHFKTVLRQLQANDKSAQQTETFHSAITLLQVAGWLKCPKDHLDKLVKLKNKVPRPGMTMTDKNKKLVSQFDDPAVLQRLLDAPKRIWETLARDKRLGARTRLAQAQAALGLSILTFMPLRLGNLTDLKFGEHLILHPGGASSLIIPAEDTKARRPIEFNIPEPLATMLFEYYTDIAPAAIGTRPDSLFCRTDGAPKGFAQVRYLVQTYFKQQVGFHMNPHAFRHLCAKLILDRNPGAHTLVQELLGHKSVETSTAFYSGLNSRRAGAHHQTLISEFLANQPPAPFNRRRKIGR